jgi:Bifunctional DNA primase/polymerase, N-terminal/Family of unknown function (DUF5906)
MSQQVRDAARAYIALGWRPVPLEQGAKFPTLESWQTLELHDGDVDAAFPDGSNVGIILGRGLVDSDLDCPEAVRMADDFLPPTEAEYGRKSKPRSHRLYWVGEDAPARAAFNDGSGMILELRAKGHQSMAPPSVHPSGEQVEWQRAAPTKAAGASYDPLLRRHRLLAVAVVLTRRWPAQGTRNECSLAVAGTLLQCGATVDEAREVIGAVARDQGTIEWKERAAAADATERARANGDPYTAGPRLAELLRGDGEAAVKVIRQFMGVDAGQEDLLDKMNARYFVVQAGGKVVVGEEEGGRLDTLWPRHEFVALHPHKTALGKKEVPIGAWWLEQTRRRQYKKIAFAPPPAEIGPRDYNIWKGWAAEADATKGWELLGAHMLEVWCRGDRRHYDYLLDWFAFMAQFSGTPAEVAIVLKGGRGAGKSWPLREIGRRWLGDHFLHVSNAAHLTGRFNAALSGKVFVFADEAFWAGDRGGEREMKRLITEPTLSIERKGIDPIEERNCVHLAVAGNESWVVPAGMKERRFFVLEVSDDHIKDRKWFDALGAEFAAGGALGFLADMRARSTSANRVRNAPVTDALRAQQEHGLGSVERWWLGKLEDGRLAPSHGGWRETAAECAGLFEDYLRQAKDAGDSRRSTEVLLAKRLRELLPAGWPRRVRRRVSGQLTYFYEFPPLAECRRAWDAAVGAPRQWPPIDEDDERP